MANELYDQVSHPYGLTNMGWQYGLTNMGWQNMGWQYGLTNMGWWIWLYEIMHCSHLNISASIALSHGIEMHSRCSKPILWSNNTQQMVLIGKDD